MSDPERLAERLVAIRARHPGSQPEMVAEIVQAVLSTMSGDLSARETSLLAEVEALGPTKAELAALRVDDINDNHIPSATDELDAIVEHTAAATDAILTSCETLDDVAVSLTGEPATKLQDATTCIYEACSFQDITGQRINKVVATLKTIETKVAQIVAAFGTDQPVPTKTAADPAEATLLNGPQRPTVAMDQSDIDKLLASFE